MLETVYQNRLDHLRRVIHQHGGTSAVAAKLDVKKQYISAVCPLSSAPRQKIGSDFARKVESAFGLPIGQLDKPADVQKSQPGDWIDIRLLAETVELGGQANPALAEVAESMRLSKNWLRHNTQATSFENLAILTVKDDTMGATCPRGGMVLIDTAITSCESDGVYAVAVGKTLCVRRLQRGLDGSLTLLSDNAAYLPQLIQHPAKSDLLIFGRVVLAWSIATKL